jgi:hypothetical protein
MHADIANRLMRAEQALGRGSGPCQHVGALVNADEPAPDVPSAWPTFGTSEFVVLEVDEVVVTAAG